MVVRVIIARVVPGSRVGDVLASKYRLEELLGSGGMGHVYRAVNQDVGRTVAIKVLHAEHAQSPQLVDRFLREARAANLVRHPNVVDVIDIGREDGGAPFIVQELLEGEDLAHLVLRRGGKLPLEEVVEILGPVIDAVAEAHARGVIHRDIKPENVFLARGSRASVPKLLDFGISKISAPDLRVTEVGQMMGTPAYMPPEQVQGARDADARSDVWALGVMLFELIAGRLPFDEGNAPALFLAIATKDAPTLLDVGAEVPPEMSRIVARCLRRKPDERYPSAAELARDLRHAAEGSAIEPTGKWSVAPRVLANVPDLAILVSRPESGPTEAATVRPGSRSASVPEAPSLIPSAPRAAATRAMDPPASDKPASAEPASAEPASVEPAAARSAAATASGLELGRMHAAPPRSAPGSRPRGGPTGARAASHVEWGVAPKESRGADTAGVLGGALVGLVVILGVGALMRIAHRPEGWPVARFVLQPGQSFEGVLHGFLALLAFGIGATYTWRGIQHCRGELGGGYASALVNAVVAAGAFFGTIELLSAVT